MEEVISFIRFFWVGNSSNAKYFLFSWIFITYNVDLLHFWHGNKHNHVAQNNLHNVGNECWCMLFINIVESLSWITYGGEYISLQGGKIKSHNLVRMLVIRPPITRYNGCWFFLIIVHKRTSCVAMDESRQETTERYLFCPKPMEILHINWFPTMENMEHDIKCGNEIVVVWALMGGVVYYQMGWRSNDVQWYFIVHRCGCRLWCPQWRRWSKLPLPQQCCCFIQLGVMKL